MGLFSTTHNYHHAGDTIIRGPERIDVHEHKAPTDESIKLLEEMHHKALQNIIGKVEVKDNLVDGKCWIVQRATYMESLLLIFKFSINGQEFTIEKSVDAMQFGWEEKDARSDISQLQEQVKDYAKAFLLYYALKKFVQIAYEQITQTKLPDYLIK